MNERSVKIDLSAQEIEAWMLSSVSEILGTPEYDLDCSAPFASYGLKSRDVVALVAGLEEWLGRRVSIALAFSYPSIETLSEHLAREMAAAGAEPRTPPADVTAAGIRAHDQDDADERIAIVGFGCRYPGGIRDADGFWRVLAEERHTVTEIPQQRWNADEYYDANPDALGKSTTRFGGFIEDIDQFDPAFFGISPREAKSMDPQHRVLLEVVWEALEQAGIQASALAGSQTGVFVGLNTHEYETLSVADLERLDGYVGTGAAGSVASGRVSYLLGAEGPSLTVDTACSSSLVAIHLAVQSLRRRECSAAIAGGVTLLLTPAAHVEFSRLRGLAPDGRCKTFDAAADGTVWSEGCGVLVLKRLSDALADGDRIRAIIRGSAVNQDGRSNGLTAPNGLSQEALIRRALVDAKLSSHDVDYVEAHGTGTQLGDPIEAQALSHTFGGERAAGHPLLLGAVKSNLGHTQAAAGVAGVVKTILALERELIPKTLHFESPNPAIAWEGSGLRLVTQAEAWPRTSRPRIAGVSSFGVSGTNAHVILEEGPEWKPQAGPQNLQGLRLPLLLSARDESALRALAGRWSTWLRAYPEACWRDIVGTAALDRVQGEERAVVLAEDAAEALSGLDALARGDADASVIRGKAKPQGRTVFVFPGQGGQWAGMARQLLRQSAVFAAAVDACDAELAPLAGWSVRALFEDEQAALERVDVVQPALFVMGVALAAVWRSLGVEPAAVVGHSQGEVAAAVVSGALSLKDGVRVVVGRSVALRGHTGHGAMLVIERSVAEVRALIARFGEALAIAVVNTPSSTVVAGEVAAIDALHEQLSSSAVFCRKVKVDYASHTAQMEGVLPEVRERIAGIVPQTPSIPFYSTVTGQLLAPSEALDAAYWCRNLRQTVRFDQAVECLRADGHDVFVEVSPHPMLSLALTSMSSAPVVVDSLQRGRGELDRIYKGLSELHVRGGKIDWQAVLAGPYTRVGDLPMHAFQRSRYWLDAARTQHDAGSFGMSEVQHGILRAMTELGGSEDCVLTGRLSAREPNWLRDHCVYGVTLLPGAATLDLLLCAARAVGARGVSELTLAQPIVLTAGKATELQLRVAGADADACRAVTVHTRTAGLGAAWTEVAAGRLLTGTDVPCDEAAFADLRRWPTEEWTPLELDHLYEKLRTRGFEYGPSFQGLKKVWRSGETLYGQVVLPPSVSDEQDYAIHPALLDAALHTMLAGLLRDDDQGVLLPFAWSDVTPYATGARELRIKVSVEADSAGEVSSTLWMADGAGEPYLHVGRLRARRASKIELDLSSQDAGRDLYRVDFLPVATAQGEEQAELEVILGSDGKLASLLGFERHGSIAELLDRVGEQTASSLRVIADLTQDGVGGPPGENAQLLAQATHAATASALGLIQQWLADPRLEGSELVCVTKGAVSSGPDDDLVDLCHGPIWGLVRAVRAEYPDRSVRLIDIGHDELEAGPLVSALRIKGEPELAVRGGKVLAARLVRAVVKSPEILQLPVGEQAWRVHIYEPGRLDGLRIEHHAPAALKAHEARIAVRATGVNFRDVLNALGVVPAPSLGLECAGVVLQTGEDVPHLSVGDRVMGLCMGSFGSVVTVDAQLVTRMPENLSFAEAATIPVAYLTALYAFDDLAHLAAGDKVLIHAAAGGVGMAAVQLARLKGAEVFATASPSKWQALRALGLDDAHLASSRDTSFEQKFSAANGSKLDVVLNSLAREFIDASLRLLKPRGQFVEMGKTDPRDPAQIAQAYAGVRYMPFDLMAVDPTRIASMLTTLGELLARGAISPLPLSAYDVRQAPSVLRRMAQAKHVGKLVLTVPRVLDPQGTVLVTGGTGEIGARLCEQLVRVHGVRHLILTSRRGSAAPGSAELVAHLSSVGAESVQVLACDVAERAEVSNVLRCVSPVNPLTAVMHLAGVLDDGTVPTQTAQRLLGAMAPKVTGALHLDALTRDLDLSAFVMFSSSAGIFGAPGQSNYAAANTFLDALAVHRQRQGHVAKSLAWGLWEQAGVGMTAHLGQAELARLARQGMGVISVSEGLSLFEAALSRPEAALVPVRLELAKAFRGASQSEAPALLRALVRPGLRRASAADGDPSSLRTRLAALPEPERLSFMVQRVQAEVASLLGLAGAAAVDPNRELNKFGLDSLMAVELRNRFSALVGSPLSSTLVFDYPTSSALGRVLLDKVVPASGTKVTHGKAATRDEIRSFAEMISTASSQQLEQFGLLSALQKMRSKTQVSALPRAAKSKVDLSDRDELLRFLEKKVGTGS